MFILKNYTTVADRKDYVMLSISLKINTTTIVDTRTASSFQKKEEATLSNILSSINTKNQSKLSNFAMKPLLRLPTSQRQLHFLLWKICYRLQLNLCTCSFSLERGFLFKLILIVCLFYTRYFFLLAEPRLSIRTRHITYWFIRPKYTINQIITYMYY